MRTFLLYAATALVEIVGSYLPRLWLRQGVPVWQRLPAVASLALFAWLLTLHDAASGRVYAAYGGVYIGAAIVWLWAVGQWSSSRCTNTPPTMRRPPGSNSTPGVRSSSVSTREALASLVHCRPQASAAGPTTAPAATMASKRGASLRCRGATRRACRRESR